MSTVHIAFRQSTNSTIWSKLIRVIAGPPVHCATVITKDSGERISYHATLGVGVEKTIVTDDWELVLVDGINADLLEQWCEQRIGAKYDWLGAILYWTPLTTRDRWTCSEFSAEGIVSNGGHVSILQASQSPRRLYRFMKDAQFNISNKGYNQINVLPNY